MINFTKLCSLLATFQRGLNVVARGDMASRRQTMSNQRWNNVVYVNVAIYNVEQRQINALYFNVYINNVRKRRSNVFIFNPDFHNVDQRRNNVVNMAIFKKLRRVKKIFLSLKKRLIWLTTLAFDCDQLKRQGNIWNVHWKNKLWKVKCMVHEKNMKIKVWVCWWQNKLI